MAGKGFSCNIDLSLHLVSSIGNYECCGEYVYITVELFGTVHRTRPQRSYYPLIFNEVVNFNKTFWSPSTEREVLEMLEDSPVSIELRRVDPCFFNGILLAYYDGNARDFLFAPYPRMPCTISGNEIFLDRTIDFKGTAPRLRYSAFSDIKPLGGFSSSNNIEQFEDKKYSSGYKRYDDGYDSPEQLSSSKSGSKQHRSRARSPSPTQSGYYQRQTVTSALRSRSPSPNATKMGGVKDRYNSDDEGEYDDEDMGEKELGGTQDSGIYDGEKPPFVVRKVPDNLLSQPPQLNSNRRRHSRRRSRSRDRVGSPSLRRKRSSSPSNKLKRSQSVQSKLGQTSTNEWTSSVNQGSARPTSPVLNRSKTRYSDLLDSLNSYRPSYCHRYCHSHGHGHHHHHSPYYSSPLVDYYTDKLRRLTSTAYHHHNHICDPHYRYCTSTGCSIGCW